MRHDTSVRHIITSLRHVIAPHHHVITLRFHVIAPRHRVGERVGNRVGGHVGGFFGGRILSFGMASPSSMASSSSIASRCSGAGFGRRRFYRRRRYFSPLSLESIFIIFCSLFSSLFIISSTTNGLSVRLLQERRRVQEQEQEQRRVRRRRRPSRFRYFSASSVARHGVGGACHMSFLFFAGERMINDTAPPPTTTTTTTITTTTMTITPTNFRNLFAYTALFSRCPIRKLCPGTRRQFFFRL